jgi:hypothetical protein
MNPFPDDHQYGEANPPYEDNNGAHEPIRRPYRIVAQTHVYYDDGTACTFTTPTLESPNMHPVVLKHFLSDYYNWINLAASSGFYCPRGHESIVQQKFANNDKQSTRQVLVMPAAAMMTHSFMDNPNDSVLSSVRYPGCEFKYQMPILVGMDLGPFPNWGARGTGDSNLPPGMNETS